jgi:S1-C subfamily serine protease
MDRDAHALAGGGLKPAGGASVVIDPLLLSVARITTFSGDRVLTAASGFFFGRGDRLFLVTARHVLVDQPSGHYPDRIDMTVHTDTVDLRRCAVHSVPLYREQMSAWRQARDSGGEVDVAAIELDPAALPAGAAYRPFGLSHLQGAMDDIGIGSSALVVGFPLGFFDTRHNLPVARQATIASAFGVRFQGQGCFLTDARTHRGSSGAPVVLRDPAGDPALPWRLLGIHSSTLDMATRQQGVDESLGLNCVWYADILDTLTA